MRDIFLLALLPFLLYAMATRPFIGLGLWIWTALFFPNAWVYGLASPIRFNLLFAGVTALAWLIRPRKPRFVLGSSGWLVLLFFCWATASTIMGMGRPDLAWDIWDRFMKVVLLFLFILILNFGVFSIFLRVFFSRFIYGFLCFFFNFFLNFFFYFIKDALSIVLRNKKSECNNKY